MARLPNEVQDRLERLIESEGLELVELSIGGTAHRPVLRVTLDRGDGEVSLADCETVSRQASVLLDAWDPFPTPFTLEVSSPGLDRRLVRAIDFVRFAGAPVRVRMRPSWPAPRTFAATLVGREGESVRLHDLAGEVRELPAGQIFEIRLDPFREEPAPGGKGQRSGAQGRKRTL